MSDAADPRLSPATRLVDASYRAALWSAYRVLRVGWRIFHPRSRGALVAVWHDERLLLVRNSYRPGLGLPAGGIGRRETPLQAAVRELWEEVGIRTDPETLRQVAEIPSHWEHKRDTCIVFELELQREPAVRIDRREIVWAGFASPAAALADDLAPPVRRYLEERTRAPGAPGAASA